MAVDLELAPKQKRPAGEPCCEPVVYPDVEREQAERMAEVAKALGDPIRLQLVDVLRKHAGKVCVCELVPLFDLSQPTVSHHLKMLRDAGIVGSERQGLWAYYYVDPRRAGGAVRMAELRRPRPTRSARPCASRYAAAADERRARSRDAAAARAAGPTAPCSTDEQARGVRRRACTTRRRRASCPTAATLASLAAATRPRSPSCTRARRCSTSAPAAASTCCSPPGASARPARPTAST